MMPGARRRSRPVSRVLFPGPKAGTAAISLGRQLPDASSDLTRSTLPEGNPDGPSSSPKRRRSLFGLAPGGVYQASPVTRGTGELLPRHFTLTPPPWRLNANGTGAVSFLWHFPSRHRDSVLRSTLPCGARTFLSPRVLNAKPAATRPALTPRRIYYSFRL